MLYYLRFNISVLGISRIPAIFHDLSVIILQLLFSCRTISLAESRFLLFVHYSVFQPLPNIKLLLIFQHNIFYF